MSVRAQANRVGTDRTGDVLEGLLAKVSELDLHPSVNVIVGRRSTRSPTTKYPAKNDLERAYQSIG